jgi:hypothetical protein
MTTYGSRRRRRSSVPPPLLVALLNYGQVAAERDGSEEGKDGAARR